MSNLKQFHYHWWENTTKRNQEAVELLKNTSTPMTTAPPTQYFEPKTPLPTKLSEMNFDDSTFAESPAIVRSPKLENTGTPVNNEKSHQIEDLSTDSYNFDTGWNDIRAIHESLKIEARIFTNLDKIFFLNFSTQNLPTRLDNPQLTLQIALFLIKLVRVLKLPISRKFSNPSPIAEARTRSNRIMNLIRMKIFLTGMGSIWN